MATRKTNTTAKKTTARKTNAKKATTKKTPAKKATAKKADKKLSQIDAALAVLKKARRPMSCKEMCRIQRGERFRKPRAWSAQPLPEQTRGEVETIRWLFKTFAREDRSARSLAVGDAPSPDRQGASKPVAG
jgi:hypothetical protein